MPFEPLGKIYYLKRIAKAAHEERLYRKEVFKAQQQNEPWRNYPDHIIAERINQASFSASSEYFVGFSFSFFSPSGIIPALICCLYCFSPMPNFPM